MHYFYSLAEARKESGGTIGEVIGYYKGSGEVGEFWQRRRVGTRG